MKKYVDNLVRKNWGWSFENNITYFNQMVDRNFSTGDSNLYIIMRDLGGINGVSFYDVGNKDGLRIIQFNTYTSEIRIYNRK